MRQLQLQATSSKKRTSNEVPEQLEKRVTLPHCKATPRTHVWFISVQEHGAKSGKTLRSPEEVGAVPARSSRRFEAACRTAKSGVSLTLVYSPPSFSRHPNSFTSLRWFLLTDWASPLRPPPLQTSQLRASQLLRRLLLHRRTRSC